MLLMYDPIFLNLIQVKSNYSKMPSLVWTWLKLTAIGLLIYLKKIVEYTG